MVTITYVIDDRTVETRSGESILHESLRAGIPHSHACGGHARGSTCRVQVIEGPCAPRNGPENAVVARLHFSPEIRLACQTTASGDVKLRRLVLDAEGVKVTAQASVSDAAERAFT